MVALQCFLEFKPIQVQDGKVMPWELWVWDMGLQAMKSTLFSSGRRLVRLLVAVLRLNRLAPRHNIPGIVDGQVVIMIEKEPQMKNQGEHGQKN